MRIRIFEILLLTGSCVYAADWGIARSGGTERPLATRDAHGAAVLTDEALPRGTTEIVFLDAAAPLAIGEIALSNRTVRFSSKTRGFMLRTDGARCPFRLGNGHWTFDGLAFSGVGVPEHAKYCGGAIDCEGGTLTVTDCRFTGLGARFNGGAISARLMTGDLSLTGCVFEGNACGVLNGTGGALYLSARRGETVTARLANCLFTGNRAQSGGAVTTVTTTRDDEVPVRLVMDGGTRFARNEADFSGGAVYAESEVTVSNAVFEANSAKVQGGAICLGGTGRTNAICRIYAPTTFTGNRATNDTTWTCGGAIALWGAGGTLEIDERNVRFDANEAVSAAGGYGGAIYSAPGTSVHVSLASFNGNAAETGGGGLYVGGGEAALFTCVFSNDTVRAETGYGGAIAADEATLAVTNATIRYANNGAVDAYRTTTEIVNTAVVDNNGATDIAVHGDDSSLVMNYVAYGNASVSDNVRETLVTNACLPGMTETIYKGTTLLLDTSGYNPVTSEGMPQDSYDHRSVEYGWQGGTSFSIGAFECPAPDDEPSVEVAKVNWYHNRADGRYYPQIVLRFLGGDASRFRKVTVTCGGVDYVLPEARLAELRAATKRDSLFYLGVDENYWKPSKNGTDFGYIVGWTNAVHKAELMLFSVTDPTRSAVTVIGSRTPITVRAEVMPTFYGPTRRTTAAVLPQTVSVAVRIDDFTVGETLAGRAETAAGATVSLYGCTALGAEWRYVTTLALDAEGAFTCAVPENLRFFRLEAEVTR